MSAPSRDELLAPRYKAAGYKAATLRVACLLSTGWRTREELALDLGRSSRALSRALAAIDAVGMGLQRRDTADGRRLEYRIVLADPAGATARSPGYRGGALLTLWLLADRDWRLPELQARLGVGKRMLSRDLRAIAAAGFDLREEDLTPAGHWRGYRTVRVVWGRCGAYEPALRRGGGSAIEEYAHLLGVRSDANIAKLADVGERAVTDYRRRRGIPAARGRRGRSAAGTTPSGDVRGLPWNPETPLYHATVALGGIRRHGFLTRAQLRARHHGGPVEATGGGTDTMVSFTMDPRIALAIVVGLETFRRIARRELSPVELLDRLEVELGAPTVRRAAEHVFGSPRAADEQLDALQRGALLKRAGGFPWEIEKLPRGARVVGWWHDAMGQTREQWEAGTWVDRDTGEVRHREVLASAYEVPYGRWELAEKLMELYKAAVALSETAYNPLFWGTRPQVFARVRQRDVGLVVARSSIPFLAPWDVLSLVDLGLISQAEAYWLEPFVQSWSIHTREAADPYPWTKPSGPVAANLSANWRCPDQIGTVPFDCGTPHLVTPATTMLHLASMREVRIGEVSGVRAERFVSYRGLVKLGVLDPRRLTYPLFVEEPGNFPVLPRGAAARRRA